MSKRLGRFLAVGFVGVVLLLAGLSWDAMLHAGDPTLAAREGLLAWRNPGHVLLGLGMGSVVVSLVGASATALSLSANPRFARPLVQRAFLAGSTALVVAAAGVTSWSAGAVHRRHAEVAAHDESGSDHTEVPAVHDQTAGAHPETVLATPIAAHGHPGVTAAHDHGPSGLATAPPGPTTHDHAGTAAAHPLPGAPSGHLHSETPAPASGGGHDHNAPSEAPPPAPGPSPAGEVTEVRYGPFVLTPAGAGGDLDHANVFIPEAPKPCEDCYILGAEPDLVYPDGSSANLDTGVMLHHAVFFNSGQPDSTCGGDEFFGGLGERFLASGNERTKKRFPPGFGYYLGTASVSGIVHVMNHSSEPKTVFVTFKVRWVPASTEGIRRVTPIWLDIENCRTSEYEVPAGPSSRHWQWKSTLTGRIIATAGHVHDGGVRTTLTNATTGQHLCHSWAGYGTRPAYMGTVESMSGCIWDALGTVQAGEILDLEAFYNSSEPVHGAMGIMVAYVYETNDLDAGTPPPPEVTGNTPPPPTSTPPQESHHPHS